MGILERKNRHKETLRQDILDAARELFVSEGYEGVSMRRIADRIEYSPATIYIYFEDKSAVLSYILEETLRKLSERMVEHLKDTEQDGLQCLVGGMRIYIQYALQYPRHYYVAFIKESPADRAEHLEGRVYNEVSVAFGFLQQAVERAGEDGSIQVQDIHVASHTVWCGIHGLAAHLIGRSGHSAVAKRTVLIAAMFRALLAGMGADRKAVDRVLAETTVELLSRV